MDFKNFRDSMIAALLVVAGLAITFLVFPKVFERSGPPGSSFAQGQMPLCDSIFTRRLLHKTIDEAPGAKQMGLKLTRIGDIEDYVGKPTPGSMAADLNQADRFCKAVVFTNAGQGDVHFHLKWIDAKKDQVWLEITVSTI